jgi:DNA-directed RNA polymerase subunit RPC12/RpoP
MTCHFKRIHKGVRYKCTQCPKEFSAPSALRYHQKRIHNPNADELKIIRVKRNQNKKKIYKCDVCDKIVTFQGKYSHTELKHYPNKNCCPFGCPDKIENESEWIAHLQECSSEKMVCL